MQSNSIKTQIFNLSPTQVCNGNIILTIAVDLCLRAYLTLHLMDGLHTVFT